MAKKEGPLDKVNGYKPPARSLPFFFGGARPEGWAFLLSAGVSEDGEELATLLATLPAGMTPDEADQVLRELGL